jgi:hypothetical protein
MLVIPDLQGKMLNILLDIRWKAFLYNGFKLHRYEPPLLNSPFGETGGLS